VGKWKLVRAIKEKAVTQTMLSLPVPARDHLGIGTIVTAVLVWSSLPTIAQSNDGIPAFSAIENRGIDAINLINLNVYITAPVRQKHGIIPFTASLEGISNCRIINVPFYHPEWYCGLAPVKALDRSDFDLSFVPNRLMGMSATSTGGGGSPLTYPDGVTRTYMFSHWVIIANDGVTTYNLPVGDGIDSMGYLSAGFADFTADGSDFTLNITRAGGSNGLNNDNPVVGFNFIIHDTAGNFTSTSGNLSGTDTNGNVVSVSSGDYTDTLNTIALSNPSAGQWNWTGTSGASQSITTSYLTNQHVQTAVGCSSTLDISSTAAELLDRVIYPDNTSLQVGYEPTPGVSGAVTGRI
jgi:hypothetical protein